MQRVKTVGIVGNGVVGNATASTLQGWNGIEVYCWDDKPERATHSMDQVLDCDLVFVCLPTPQCKGSLACDTTILDNFLSSVFHLVFSTPHHRTNTRLVIRSTTPVGWCREQARHFPNLVHFPEFLSERTALKDAANPTRLLIGFPNVSPDTQDKVPNHPLVGLVRSRWPDAHTFAMSSDESEFVKLAQNAFSAVKIAAFNELRCFADAVDLNWNGCLEALLAGGWINPMHTQVPGPDGRRGFGGKCLPKDLANLVHCMEQSGVTPTTLYSASRWRNDL